MPEVPPAAGGTQKLCPLRQVPGGDRKALGQAERVVYGQQAESSKDWQSGERARGSAEADVGALEDDD